MAIRNPFHLFSHESHILQRMKPAVEQGMRESIMASPWNGGGKGRAVAAAPAPGLPAESAALTAATGGIVP